MFRFSQMRTSRTAGVVAGGAVLAILAAGVTLAATSGGYQACANSSGRLALENSSGNCPANFNAVTVGAQGPQGPSGVVSMTQYSPNAEAPVTGSSFAFLGSPPEQTFSNKQTAAQVTATVEEASENGNQFGEDIGICYEPVGGSSVTVVSDVGVSFAAAAGSYFAQTVSGVVGDLKAGTYYVGLCAVDQTDVLNGGAAVTILLAQTKSGVSVDGPRISSVPAGQQ